MQPWRVMAYSSCSSRELLNSGSRASRIFPGKSMRKQAQWTGNLVRLSLLQICCQVSSGRQEISQLEAAANVVKVLAKNWLDGSAELVNQKPAARS